MGDREDILRRLLSEKKITIEQALVDAGILEYVSLENRKAFSRVAPHYLLHTQGDASSDNDPLFSGTDALVLKKAIVNLATAHLIEKGGFDATTMREMAIKDIEETFRNKDREEDMEGPLPTPGVTPVIELFPEAYYELVDKIESIFGANRGRGHRDN